MVVKRGRLKALQQGVASTCEYTWLGGRCALLPSNTPLLLSAREGLGGGAPPARSGHHSPTGPPSPYAFGPLVIGGGVYGGYRAILPYLPILPYLVRREACFAAYLHALCEVYKVGV